MNDVTRILAAIEKGDSNASDELLPLVYDELRRLAAHRIMQESPGQTLQATALVHEAYLRLVNASLPQRWDSRGHFFAAAAEAMRRILIDQARRKAAQVHGGAHNRVEFAEGEWFTRASPEELVDLNDSLQTLASDDPVAAKIVNLRIFLGLSVEETAECLAISSATAYRHWNYGRAFLRAERLS